MSERTKCCDNCYCGGRKSELHNENAHSPYWRSCCTNKECSNCHTATQSAKVFPVSETYEVKPVPHSERCEHKNIISDGRLIGCRDCKAGDSELRQAGIRAPHESTFPHSTGEGWEKKLEGLFPELPSATERDIKVFIGDLLAKEREATEEADVRFFVNILDGVDIADKTTGNVGGGTKAIRHALQARYSTLITRYKKEK